MNILLNYRIQNFFLQKPDTRTDSSEKPWNWKCTHTTWKEKMDWSWANLGKPCPYRLKERRQAPEHNSYHPMAPLPRSDTGLFLLYVLVLLQASTCGHCPPQPVSLNQTHPFPIPPPDWPRLHLSQTFTCINTLAISTQLLFLSAWPMKME